MSDRPLRFCMVTTFYPPHSFGGDATYVRQLSEALARRGHSVEVVCNPDAYRFLGGRADGASGGNGNLTVHALESRVPALSLVVMQQTGGPGFHARRLRQILDGGRFDVVHFHNVSLAGGPSVLGYSTATKLYTTHEHWLICPTHVLWKFDREPCTAKSCLACTLHSGRLPQLWRYTNLVPRMVRRLDAILCPSRFTMRRHLDDGLRGNFIHMPYFISPPPEAPLRPPPAPYFLVVARLEKIKGVQTLFPVFERYTAAELWIAGTGNYEEELRRLAANHPRVKFLGRKDAGELRALYRNATALIVPSLCFETFGIVILEAFAQGTPAIARRLGALSEVLDESSGGCSYATDGELLAAMAHIQNNPADRERMAGMGRRTLLERWTETPHMERYLGLVEELGSRRGAGPASQPGDSR